MKQITGTLLAFALTGLCRAASAEIQANNSGTLLTAESSIASASSPSTGALTLANSSASITDAGSNLGSSSTSSFTMPFEVPSAPTYAGGSSPIFVAPEIGLASLATTWNSDSFATADDIQPVPEPSTWCAAALTAAVIVWRLRHRLGRLSLAEKPAR